MRVMVEARVRIRPQAAAQRLADQIARPVTENWKVWKFVTRGSFPAL